jgi:hypothetical protein
MSKGKYNSARDELLHRMTAEMWGNQSSGDVAAPTGAFSLITISDTEKAECAAAFADDLTELSVPMPTGAFLVREDSQGFVTVDEHPTETAATVAYRELERTYAAWAD